jgi:nitroreductase
MEALHAITGRQSVREYDASVKLTKKEILTMLEQASSAPSSWNLQPWRFVVIDKPETKLALKPHVFFNVPQLETSSAFILILNDLQRYELFPMMNQQELKAGYVTEEQAKVRQQKADQAKATRSKESLEKEGLVDCGIVSQNLMIVARAHGFDSCPMGGFDRAKTMDILGLDMNRYQPVMLISIGKKVKESRQTLRLPIETITEFK